MKVKTLFKSVISFTVKYRLLWLIVLTATDAGLIIKYNFDNNFLSNYAEQYISESGKESDTAVQLATAIRNKLVAKRNSGSFIAPVFRFLRPTARQIAESGGDCADKSRLLITLLKLKGIDASKVALYDDQEKPRHAVVEVKIENDQEMAIDAYYGLYFPKPGGGYYSVWDIQQDESILKSRIDSLLAQGNDVRRPRLSRYPYHKYTYRQPRTINWDKSFVMQGLYTVLTTIFGQDAINRLERPYITERPALMLLAVCLFLQLVIAITYLPVINRKLLKTNES